MSLRTNLAARPFYNERAANAAIVALAVIVAIVSGVNVVRLVSLTTRDRALTAETTAAEARIRELRADAARARAGIDGSRLAVVSDAVREVNAVIDGRTLSWTALFNWLETALPPDVRITAITPRIDSDGRFVLGFAVESESVGGIDEFLVALEATGRFEGLLVRQERENDEGLIEAVAEGFFRRADPAPAEGR